MTCSGQPRWFAGSTHPLIMTFFPQALQVASFAGHWLRKCRLKPQKKQVWFGASKADIDTSFNSTSSQLLGSVEVFVNAEVVGSTYDDALRWAVSSCSANSYAELMSRGPFSSRRCLIYVFFMPRINASRTSSSPYCSAVTALKLQSRSIDRRRWTNCSRVCFPSCTAVASKCRENMFFGLT